MTFNPNALSDEEYYAMQQMYLEPPTIDLLNLAQVVGYPQGYFDPNALSDEEYYAMQQQYLNPGGAPQYYNAPVTRPAPQHPRAPVPSSVVPAPRNQNDFTGTPYGPQMTPYAPPLMMPLMIQPPADWAPQAMSPYAPYYG